MITFLVCLALLVAAYFGYGRYLERVAGIEPAAEVPSKRLYDGVDYVPMPRWRVFLIQLLNIAGVGPIFGAILGACFGPVAFLWITGGGIFMGAMHDFLSGVMSMRNDGRSIPEVIGKYLGRRTTLIVSIFTIVLLILVGVVFMKSPAGILAGMVPSVSGNVWIAIIVVYYFAATLLPVDKVIGRLYPLFGAALIFMAAGLLAVLLFRSGEYVIPELSFRNFQADVAKMPIMPTLFITIACGAISGFHATQSPMMARCITNERESRSVFYGAMISESIIALIWAAIAMAFFGGAGELSATLREHNGDAAWAVNTISRSTLGIAGGILAVLGVVAAPITSGDTAFRSARLIIADLFGIEQKSRLKRLYISLPLFAVAVVILCIDFDVLWRYFAWTNQTLAVVVLWSITVWLAREGRNMWVALPVAVFMTYVCSSFVFVSDQFLGLGVTPWAYVGGGILTALITALMWIKILKERRNGCREKRR